MRVTNPSDLVALALAGPVRFQDDEYQCQGCGDVSGVHFDSEPATFCGDCVHEVADKLAEHIAAIEARHAEEIKQARREAYEDALALATSFVPRAPMHYNWHLLIKAMREKAGEL